MLQTLKIFKENVQSMPPYYVNPCLRLGYLHWCLFVSNSNILPSPLLLPEREQLVSVIPLRMTSSSMLEENMLHEAKINNFVSDPSVWGWRLNTKVGFWSASWVTKYCSVINGENITVNNIKILRSCLNIPFVKNYKEKDRNKNIDYLGTTCWF